MRSCIYCGKELEKGEKCMCTAAVKARGEKQPSYENENTAQDKNKKTYSGWQENVYRTGYTKKEKKKFRDRFKRVHKVKKTKFNTDEFKNAAGDVSGFAKRFMKEPICAVSNPGILNTWQLVFIVLFTSILLSLCGYFAYARLVRVFAGAFTAVPWLNIPSYSISTLLKSTLSGTGVLVFVILIYLAVLFCVNKFIMKQQTSFKAFITRPIAAMTPLLVLSAVGAVINFFSVYAMIMLVMTGFIMWLVLTYEALRTEWSYASAEKAMYAMVLAFFVFFVVMFNILRVI